MESVGSTFRKSCVSINGLNPHTCGYCKCGKSDSSISYGFLSDYMIVEDYEKLMLSGWRRSGTYFYKPIAHQTCCPCYPIRLRASDFQPTKSQRKVLKKVISQSSTLEISTEVADFSEEKYLLYKKYQISVHHDAPEDITRNSFTRFLVTSPLRNAANHTRNGSTGATVSSSSIQREYGTYHQLYRLNGELIAVGVLDLLPTGISSVYCFYDPDHRDLALGKFTILKEIDFCLSKGYEYYYMGFYIHSCPKMNYKGDYHPSELLCPSSYTWRALSECILILDKYKYTPLNELLAAQYDQEMIAKNGAIDITKYLPTSSNQQLITRVPLCLSQTRQLSRISEITIHGQEILKPILEEWVMHLGDDLVTTFIVYL